MLNVAKKLYKYIRRNIRLIFSGQFIAGGLYSFVLLIPYKLQGFFSKSGQDFFVGMVNNINRNIIKKIKYQGGWKIELDGLFFDFGYITNDLLEIGYSFIKNKNKRLANCLHNPTFFEGPYLKKGCTIKKNDYVFDMGANLGIFSVFASREVGINGRVFAFEPNKAAADIIKNNAKLNNINNIEIVNEVLGDKNAEVDFYVDLDNAFVLSAKSLNNNSKNFKIIKTSQITLDYFVATNKIDQVDFIKVDIEGAERAMLAGAEQTIRRFKPNIAIRIYHLPDDPEVIEEILKDYVPEYKIDKFGRNTLYAYL